MKYTVFTYLDKETNKFNPPAFAPIEEEGVIESIIDTCKKGKLDGAEFYILHILGTYETETGQFALLDEPKKICDLGQYVKGHNA